MLKSWYSQQINLFNKHMEENVYILPQKQYSIKTINSTCEWILNTFSSIGEDVLETLWVSSCLLFNLSSQKIKPPRSLMTNGGNKWDFEGESEKCPGSLLWSGYRLLNLKKRKAIMKLRGKEEKNRSLTRIQIICSFISSNSTSYNLLIRIVHF